MAAGEDPAAAGHFTTMQVRDGAVQGLDLHIARLRAANRELFDAALDEGTLRARIRAALAESGQGASCTLRMLVRRAPDAPSSETVELEFEPPRFPSTTPLRVRSHRGLRARPGIKHLALGSQLEARRAAQDDGFDDALLVDGEGCMAEGTFWNLALWDGDAVVWPEAPILEGVTQQRLQEALRGAGVPQRRAVVVLDGLADMRAAFALNSRGLQDIAAIDGRALAGDPALAGQLRELLATDAWQRP